MYKLFHKSSLFIYSAPGGSCVIVEHNTAPITPAGTQNIKSSTVLTRTIDSFCTYLNISYFTREMPQIIFASSNTYMDVLQCNSCFERCPSMFKHYDEKIRLLLKIPLIHIFNVEKRSVIFFIINFYALLSPPATTDFSLATVSLTNIVGVRQIRDKNIQIAVINSKGKLSSPSPKAQPNPITTDLG